MNIFGKAISIVQRAVQNEYSSWYRDFYAKKQFDVRNPNASAAYWRTIPFVTKDDLVRVPVDSRLFIPRSDVDVIRSTSGTTGSGILCMPRTRPEVRADTSVFPDTHVLIFNYHMYWHLRAKNHFSTKHPKTGRPLRALVGDQRDMKTTASAMRALGIESIQGSPSHLLMLSESLSQSDTDAIEDILLGAEQCSTLQLEAIRRIYRRARVRFSYASADAQGIVAVSPREEIPDHPRAQQVRPQYLMELIDAEGTIVDVPGLSGEIVLTLLRENVAFPLIRYRTGDTAVLIQQSGERMLVELRGRLHGSRIRIPGGEIVLKLLEGAIRESSGGSILDFSAAIQEVTAGEVLRTQLSITLYVRTMPADFGGIGTAVAEHLKVNQDRTYADGVRAGIYAPIVVDTAVIGERQGKRLPLVDLRI